MKDNLTTLGTIVKEIAQFPNIGRPVTDLQDLFVEFANIIAAQVAGSRSEVKEEQQESSSVFRSLGSIDMWPSESYEEVSVNAKMNNKIAIRPHGPNDCQDYYGTSQISLSFGEVKTSSSIDLSDRLVGQILRYFFEYPRPR